MISIPAKKKTLPLPSSAKTGVIVGSVIGGVFLIILVSFLILFLLKKYKFIGSEVE